MTHNEHPIFGPAPSLRGLEDEVIAGLHKQPKELPCKLFYDAEGSRLFDRICELPEYYLTRTEVKIMQAHIDAMAAALGPECLLIELGSGSSIKTRLLLDHIPALAGYIPVDISAEHLAQSAADLQKGYPHLRMAPVAADYLQPLDLPAWSGAYRRRVIYFPGSTIGNFTCDQARIFLTRLARIAGPNGALLIGVDLKKDPRMLHAAYNDREGVTAAFNRNILRHINRELGADFQTAHWEHRAVYNPDPGRIEMYLVSRRTQRVSLNGSVIPFARDETILTEYSYKYSLQDFADLASGAWNVRQVWTDADRYFSVQYLTVD